MQVLYIIFKNCPLNTHIKRRIDYLVFLDALKQNDFEFPKTFSLQYWKLRLDNVFSYIYV